MTYSTEVSHTQTTTGNRDFSVTFPFLATSDLKVQLNGVTKSLTTHYIIVQSGANTVVNFNTAPADNDTIRIFRDTDIDAIEATYAAGSSIRASDLNTNNTQLLYAAQEFGTLKTDNSVSFSLGNKGDVQINSSTDWSIKSNAIDLAMMNDNSVGTNELVNDSVTVDKVANNAITTDQLASNAVDTNAIVDDAVTLAKLAAEVSTAFNNPVGTVIWYAGSSAPAGYLKANGDAIANGSGTTQSITADFSELYAIVGSTLPDLRGEFIRGWDDGKGTDSGRAIKSTQTSTNQQHNHSATSTGTVSTTTNLVGTANPISEGWGSDGVASGIFSRQTGYSNNKTPGGPDTNDSGRLTVDANHNHTTSISTSIANEGGESRPRNMALLACIKY